MYLTLSYIGATLFCFNFIGVGWDAAEMGAPLGIESYAWSVRKAFKTAICIAFFIGIAGTWALKGLSAPLAVQADVFERLEHTTYSWLWTALLALCVFAAFLSVVWAALRAIQRQWLGHYTDTMLANRYWIWTAGSTFCFIVWFIAIRQIV